MKRIGKNETTEMAPVKKCFVGLETALYLLFLALDAFSAGGDGVKYLTIVVCLLAAVWSARHGGSRLMAWAMAFTLAADTFLLLLDRWYGMGIVLFCVVQGLYLARIRRACGRTLWALRAGLAAAWVLLNALGMGTALNLLAALYFVNFLVNACQSLTLRSERLFAAGLWLFLLCDVCVGLRNQPSLLPGLAGAAQDVVAVAVILELIHHSGAESLAVEQRCLAILFAREIAAEREYIVGPVLIHRGIGVGADKQQRVGAVAHENHQNAQCGHGEDAHRELAGAPEPCGKRYQQHHRNPQRAAYEGDARQEHCKEKRPADGIGRALAVKFADRPYHHCHKEHGIDQHAHVVAPAEDVDKEQFEILGHFDESGHEAEEYQRDDSGRDGQCYQRAGGCGVAELTVIDHQHDGGDAEQIEQMHSYRYTYYIGYEHQIAVAVRQVGAVFPFEN